ncbi:hypothetical protein CERZMDRAFT_89590 [Cercospora zeae-maydis SCOH1-5]|uniref:Uncharacterized protein n=1 Tax=Cercospora zeae-maydis SCOH1-5 TaxID=717836 RepID=A0A6A6FWV4_9PEZI|nr:hypothetical protein CERZMDRAFT_89590 [Cercospora zeae-maydis SCOH1-5]
MNGLMPYDTTKSLNYITTLAQAYIPGDLVNTLQMDLHTQVSRAYDNPDEAVRMLMSMINPTIPILPGANMDASGQGGPKSYGPGGGSGDNEDGGTDGSPIGGDTSSSQKIKGTSVGIGVGAVAGAAVYAAAMVYVARRYRNKRKSHKRASSVGTHGEMTERSPGTPGTLTGGMGGYFMSGGNGRGSGTTRGSGVRSSGSAGGRGSRNSAGSSNNRSVRDQGISAPVMAENSLGWN